MVNIRIIINKNNSKINDIDSGQENGQVKELVF